MKNLVLIMSSQLVDHEMRIEVGRIPPALIPVNGQPLYRAICDRYTDLPGETEICLVVNQGFERVEEVVAAQTESDVQLIRVAQLPDLGEAVAAALEQVALDQFDNLILNFGDTLIETDLDLSQDAVFYDDLEESYRWTTFTEIDGRIAEMADKGLVDGAGDNHVFTGMFLIKNGADFLECLKESSPAGSLSRFYTSLKHYLDARPYQLSKVRQWHDFGHADNYYQTRKKFINKRFFNELTIDDERAVITKRSTNGAKLRAEIEWYKNLPTSLKCYAPQVYDCAPDAQPPWIAMEYYGYPTVAELYLNSGHDLGIWSHLFKGLFCAIERMRAESITPPKESVRLAIQDMYVDKTIARLNLLRGHPVLGRYFSHSSQINSREYSPLDAYIEQLRDIRSWLEPATNLMSVIHGDLCISNILYDPRSRIIKFIDPRGQFGPWPMHGDYRYDLAKLSHSFNGNYEPIIHNRFFLMCEETEISLTFNLGIYQQQVSQLFNGHLQRCFSKDLSAIQLIEALLFLSMIPLHADHINHQLAFFAVGLQKLDNSFRQRGLES